MKKWLMAGIIGGIIAYYLDPKMGKRRRNVAMDKLGSTGRQVGSQAAGTAQNLSGKAQGIAGVAHQAMPHKHDNPNPDDLTLRDRVETEIFRDTETSRENININVIGGVVEVRGQLPTQTEIDGLVQHIRGIRDVKGVHSYLHLPGTPAPNKKSVYEAEATSTA